MGWHICLIDTTDSHRLGTSDNIIWSFYKSFTVTPDLNYQYKHSPYSNSYPNPLLLLFSNFKSSFGGNRPENGGKARLTAFTFFFFSFFVVQIDLKYCRIPHLSKPRSLTSLENNQSELWAALKSPLLSYYKRLTTVSCKVSKWTL